MQATTLTGKELSDLHNAGCKLHFAIQSLESTLAPAVLRELREAQALLQAGIDRPRKESDKIEDDYRDLAALVAKDAKLKSVWSAGVVNFKEIPHPKATKMVYEGDKKLEVNLIEGSWLGLWKAADTLIRESRDSHHIFVEGFETRNGDETTLYLCVGS